MTGLGTAKTRIAAVLLSVASASAFETAAAQIDSLSQNGWHSWQVETVDDAPESCCHYWNGGRQTPVACELDGRRGGYGTDSFAGDPTGRVQIYALMQDGKATKLRALSPRCAVSTRSPVADLSLVDADDSIAWLKPYIERRTEITPDALAAVALHRGDRARRLLVDLATSSGDRDTREESIFWMAQARPDETLDHVRRLMFADDDPHIRQRAAFAFAQSDAAGRAEALIRQGNQDPDAGVRSQAWFSLAQTEAGESESAITNAIASDTDRNVRHQAVFALSELPEERAVKALVSVVEDRDLPSDAREQALFWLAQSESDSAFAFIERLLADR